MKNLNLLFNKSYFRDLGRPDYKTRLDAVNRELFDTVFSPGTDYAGLPEGVRTHSFLLKTAYPGLLAGTGYAHEAEDGSDSCIKLGFSFDYGTGQPYIPGSSVKGVLRSWFRPETVREIAREELKISPEDLAKLDERTVGQLESSIFDGRDVFFDAVVRYGNRERKVVGPDYITPHKSETQSPIPLLMMKILPDVVFEFRFRLKDSAAENGFVLTADQKQMLFSALLRLFGVGAKTNSGYGVLLGVSAEEAAEREKQSAMPLPRPAAPVPAGAPRPRPAPAQPPRPVPAGDRHPCPGSGCGRMIEARFPLCRDCLNKARSTGICAVCGAPTRPSNYGGYFEFCNECNRKYRNR